MWSSPRKGRTDYPIALIVIASLRNPNNSFFWQQSPHCVDGSLDAVVGDHFRFLIFDWFWELCHQARAPGRNGSHRLQWGVSGTGSVADVARGQHVGRFRKILIAAINGAVVGPLKELGKSPRKVFYSPPLTA